MANIDALKVKLEKRLEPYKGIVLPPDQIGEGKKMIAELNKEKKAVDDQCKKVMREHRATADPFYNGMKELVGMYDEATADMKKQVAESEAARKVEIATKLAGELTAKWDELGVNPEFRNAVSDDLATLTAATPAGNLTGKVCQEVLARATADKSLQDRTEMRLLKLENESYKAGLHAPLTRDHVNTFIF
ncbi:DUF1351 domain-containing protein, partial [Litorivivens sp.]|uniref:DUF1351 domain-containing protein n=1 Tax=Litorivivens sp. TaxID=2020868 RepID=UPI003561E156